MTAPRFLRHPDLYSAILFVLAGLLSAFAAQAAPYTSIDDIIDTADTFLEQQVQDYLTTSQIAGRHQIRIGRLDSRLRMKACSEPLQASLENTEVPIGRLSIRIRCPGSAPWALYVPAQVSLHRDIVVTRHPVKRNTVLQAGDLMLAERDISALSQGYLLDIGQVAGSLSIRALPANQPVLSSMIRTPPVIKRGDQVIISATSGPISVRMPGEALSDGSTGQQIKVRNIRSQRVIHAIVTGPGQVEAPM